MIPRGPVHGFLSLALLVLLSSGAVRSQAPTSVSSWPEVRPILADHCFACHGPDASTREAELRLDVREVAIADRGGYAAIVPGAPDRSELLRRVRDGGDPMPPAEHEPLRAEQIAVLERWIADGARYDRHWAYVPPRAGTVPQPAEDAWPVGEVDRFVLHGLEQVGLRPAPSADPRTLVRRLSFDLLGLPPTDDRVVGFAADPSDVAWAALVDELLASPHHAERLATFWFDLVRFADTTGIHADNRWNVYPYRDWVLEAFRSNMPFDRLTIEQLAGDLLPEATLSQQVAAAYNRLNLITREGGSQPKEFLIRYTADRVRNVSEVWLAASMGCCECHDHKFDPLSTREFYELGAFFADIDQVGVYREASANNFAPELEVLSREEAARQAGLERELAAVVAALSADTAELRADRAVFEAELRDQGWQTLRATSARSEAGATLATLEDGSLRASGALGERGDVYELEFELPAMERLAALRLELLADESLPQRGPGRAQNGNVVLSEIEFAVGDRRLQIGAGRASYEQRDYGVARALDGEGGRSGWAVMRGSEGTPAEAVFEFADPLLAPAIGTLLRVRCVQDYGPAHVLGRWRISVAERVGLEPLEPGLRAALESVSARRTSDQELQLRDLHRSRTELLATQRRRKAELDGELRELRAGLPRVLRTRAVEPMVTRVRPRGNWMDDSGQVVQPGVPAAFGLPLEGEGRATRLDLARWLVDRRHPITARVMVNRIWRMLFGHGIVATLDDFGVQGEEPTDPLLLDFLARRFVDSGWDLRALLRTLVSSRAYRQASWVPGRDLDDAERAARFGRQTRFRLDAEFVRDQALVASGLLTDAFGGPSVRPYQPAGYWEHLNFPRRTYEPSTGPELHRRALYGHWQRQYLHPSLMVFDAPSRERCTAERARSNTPLAALAALNDPIFVEAARALAQRVLLEAGSDDAVRIERMWRLTLQRSPTPSEMRRVAALVGEHRAHFAAAPADAAALLAVGASPRDGGLDPAEHAAWTSAARVLLNLHETITRD